MGSGKRYQYRKQGKLNVIKVVVVVIIVLISIFCVYKLKSTDKPNETIELGREIPIKETKIEEKDKTIDDYMEEYSAVLIEKVKEDTYYVSIDGKECTLYSDGTIADSKIPLWNGESKELKIEKDTKEITINNAQELKWIADQVISGEKNFNDITVILNENIDLGGRILGDGSIDGNKWNSIIGFLETSEDAEEENLKGFSGVFDGNNHWIRGLVIESNDRYQGLFGYLTGEVRNLVIKDSYISGNDGVGAFVGLNNGKIENCKLENTIVKGISNVGGFVGIGMINSNIERCSNEKDSSNISGNEYVGGIVGYLNNNSNILECENRSIVSGSNYVGGVAGILFFGVNVNGCCNLQGKITGEDYVGGIAGYSQAQIVECYNKTNIVGNSYVGGLVGTNYITGNISSSFNSGEVEGSNDFIGGIAGVNNATIVSTYNTGKIASTDLEKEVSIGGICGQNLSESVVNNSYNIGEIVGNGYTGGIIGADFGVMANCYYLDSSIKVKTKDAKTEEEMKTIGLDEDFKEDINHINNGFKVLSWQ